MATDVKKVTKTEKKAPAVATLVWERSEHEAEAPKIAEAGKKPAVAKVLAKKEKPVRTVQEGYAICKYCGKSVRLDEEDGEERGDRCKHVREELGMDETALVELRKSMSAEVPPEGWIKVAVLDKVCKRQGVPVSRMVKAIGGDRGLEPPLNEKFRVLYVHGVRYVDGYCATSEGLAAIMGDKPARGKAAKMAAAAQEVKKLEGESA